ncbi:MAG: folylpolyglutamate synthase [Dehalococcoidia bacterium]|nr:folylpolyglutamate synthase [Dehalococcoidia bacterium]
MEYKEAVERILGLVDHERVGAKAGIPVRYDLEQVTAFLGSLGNPHLGIPTAHIAGTKGKGSTAAMVASVLSVAGYNPGLYTSPHLHTFRERIQVGGELITEEEFARLTEYLEPFKEELARRGHGRVTLFDFLTVMAFCHFKGQGARAQVIEVGLGGRLDSTNVVQPLVCGITSLGLDHTEVLGDTLEKIAREKAGIIKPGIPVVCAPQKPEAMAVVQEVCGLRESPLTVVGADVTWEEESSSMEGQAFRLDTPRSHYHLQIPLLGGYQLENAAVAVGMVEALVEGGLDIDASAIGEGLRRVEWPCRLEVLQRSPLLMVDGAHNPHAAHRMVEAVREMFPHRRILLMVGIGDHKDLAGLVAELAVLAPAAVLATRSRHPRAIPPRQIARAFGSYGVEVHAVNTVSRALQMAQDMAKEDDLILTTGSLFVAAEVRELLKGIAPETYPVLEPYQRVGG